MIRIENLKKSQSDPIVEAQARLEKKRRKNLIFRCVLLDFLEDLREQQDKLPAPKVAQIINSLNFILEANGWK